MKRALFLDLVKVGAGSIAADANNGYDYDQAMTCLAAAAAIPEAVIDSATVGGQPQSALQLAQSLVAWYEKRENEGQGPAPVWAGPNINPNGI